VLKYSFVLKRETKESNNKGGWVRSPKNERCQSQRVPLKKNKETSYQRITETTKGKCYVKAEIRSRTEGENKLSGCLVKNCNISKHLGTEGKAHENRGRRSKKTNKKAITGDNLIS